MMPCTREEKAGGCGGEQEDARVHPRDQQSNAKAEIQRIAFNKPGNTAKPVRSSQ